MEGHEAFIWFVATTATFFTLLIVGTFFAVRAYDEHRRRALVHLHLPHPHLPHPTAHRAEGRRRR